jgi:hypothetical protein
MAHPADGLPYTVTGSSTKQFLGTPCNNNMRSSYLPLLLSILAFCATRDASAFVAPRNLISSTTPTQTFEVISPASLPQQRHFLESAVVFQLQARKEKSAVKDDVDKAVEFQWKWLSPTNPYMLFVYPILFIFAVDFFHLGPSSH